MLDQGASLLCPWIDEFTRHPGLLDPMEDLLGPDLLVWGVSLRLKEPDGRTFAGWASGHRLLRHQADRGDRRARAFRL